MMVVLEGNVRIICGDRADDVVDEGGVAFLPRGRPHAFWAHEQSRLLLVFTPGGVGVSRGCSPSTAYRQTASACQSATRSQRAQWNARAAPQR